MEFEGILFVVAVLALLAVRAKGKAKSQHHSPAADRGGLSRSEVVALSEDLDQIPGSSTALELSEPPLAVQPVEDLVPSSMPCSSTESQAEEPGAEAAAAPPETDIGSSLPQSRELQELQAPARRSISETLRAASAEEEPTEGAFEDLLGHLEASLMQVECRHAVALQRAELHLLTLLGGLRDFLTRSLRSQPRHRSMELVGCARASRLRAVLDSLQLSPGRSDDRLVSCRAVCDAVDEVLADFGLQETLRQEQHEKRLALQRALGEKRREEAELHQVQKPAVEDALGSPRGDHGMLNWMLTFAEALSGKVGIKLSGIWLFAHACHLGL